MLTILAGILLFCLGGAFVWALFQAGGIAGIIAVIIIIAFVAAFILRPQ